MNQEKERVSANPEKKTDFVRIRVTPELAEALRKSAEAHRRTDMDHARYLLELCLGLIKDKDLGEVGGLKDTIETIVRENIAQYMGGDDRRSLPRKPDRATVISKKAKASH